MDTTHDCADYRPDRDRSAQGLRVAPLADPAAIQAVLSQVADKLRHDGRDPGYIDHPLVRYFGAYRNGALVGIFTAVDFTPWEVEVHVAILPCAIRDARALCRLFLAKVFVNPEVMRATAYVLGTLRSAANLCRKLGFMDEGRRRDACQVAGVATDVVVLGMTRRDWSGTHSRHLLRQVEVPIA